MVLLLIFLDFKFSLVLVWRLDPPHVYHVEVVSFYPPGFTHVVLLAWFYSSRSRPGQGEHVLKTREMFCLW